MKKLALLALFNLLFFTIALYADTPYFYGGDFDPNYQYANGLLNVGVGDYNPYLSATYQNFYALSNITATGLFTNNFSNIVPDSGYWELRSGLSPGNGGTLIASGTGAMTNTPTGRNYVGYDEYTNLVSGLSVTLAAGQYWFAAVPVCMSCNADAYNSNTPGLNSIGKSDLNQQYLNDPDGNINFENLPVGVPNFSSGVYATENVPEPASLLLMGTAITGAMGALRRKML